MSYTTTQFAPTSNIYNVLLTLDSRSDFVTTPQDDTVSISSQDSEDDDLSNQPDSWEAQAVDLHYLEDNILRNRPVFTRSRLQEYAMVRDRILTDKSFDFYWGEDINGIRRLIYERNSDEDDIVDMKYLTYVELHPDMHVNYVPRSPAITHLHDLNDCSQGDDHIPCPAVFQSAKRTECYPLMQTGYEDHLDAALMARWRAHIAHIQQLWQSSGSFRHLKNGFQHTAAQFTQIKKIVGFGLGRLQGMRWGTRGDSQEVLQHLTAFSIAEMLNTIYQAQDPSTEPIKVVFQDPLYTPKDEILLREAYPHGPVAFVADPDGFLEVDDNTLVMSAFITKCCPVMQICTDLCRPAGFLCDSMKLDTARSFYTWYDRASPRVARRLESYRKVDFGKVEVEKELSEDVCGGLRYWLQEMNLWLNPRGKE
jgi:hypothetical protein